jgi:flavodoxin
MPPLGKGGHDAGMTYLVTYFSRTGNTAALAHQIAMRLGVAEEPILEHGRGDGIWGSLTGAVGAALGRASPVGTPQNDPAGFDLVLIGTPVWAAAVPPAVNGWIDAHRDKCKQVAFFATSGGVGFDRTFSRMRKRIGKAPVAHLAVNADRLNSDETEEALDHFISNLKATQS